MDPNRTQSLDVNKTVMGTVPTINATQVIKPVQCPVCKSFNPAGVMFCVDCGLIFDRALPDDAFGAPTIRMPVLVDEAGREHTLRPGENILGRQGDIALDDARVSRRHASINVGEDLILKDLGSTNGTKLGNDPITAPALLEQGSVVSLGGFKLTLSLPGVSAKTAMPIGGQTIQTPPPTTSPSAFLVNDSTRYPLYLGANSFGRRDSNSIVIDDAYVSGAHGVIEVEEGGIYLTDLGSTNGTMLNDAKLGTDLRTSINEDDVIRLGSLEFRIERP